MSAYRCTSDCASKEEHQFDQSAIANPKSAISNPKSAISISGSYVEAEKYDVAFLHGVILTFKAQGAFTLGLLERSTFQHPRKRYHFRFDKAPFDIGMNNPRSLLSCAARRNSPGPDLRLSSSKEGNQPQKLVGLLDDPGETASGEPEVFHEQPGVFFRKRCNLSLDLATNGRDAHVSHSGVFLKPEFFDRPRNLSCVLVAEIEYH